MATAKDPVCAMDVDTASPPGGKSVHNGQTYYFCSSECQERFEQDPLSSSAPRSRSAGLRYFRGRVK